MLAGPRCPTLTDYGSFKRPLSGPFDGLTRCDLGQIEPLPLARSCDRLRSVSPMPRPHEGLLSAMEAGAQLRPQERVLMPITVIHAVPGGGQRWAIPVTSCAPVHALAMPQGRPDARGYDGINSVAWRRGVEPMSSRGEASVRVLMSEGSSLSARESLTALGRAGYEVEVIAAWCHGPIRVELAEHLRPTNGCNRSVSLVVEHSGDRLLSEPIAGTQPGRRQPLFMPQFSH